jgi:hypothetical protein
MDRDNLEELRKRLLREEKVQQMIRARAYEIYRMRGAQPGGATGDWLKAEGEVLAFLLANESHRAIEEPSAQAAGLTPPAVVENKTPSPGKSATRKTSKAKQGDRKKPGQGRVASKKSPLSAPKPRRTRKKPEGNDRKG